MWTFSPIPITRLAPIMNRRSRCAPTRSISVRAAAPAGTGDDLWNLVEQLNQTRNKLAHNAEVADFDQKVDALIKLYAEDGFTHASTARDRASRLRTTLALVCGILHGMGRAISELTKNK
jgi:hypothetical protein